MRAIILASTALVLAIPVAAQTVQERLEKARTEVNATKNAASRALYAIDQALKAVVPAPTPTPTPPTFEDAPLAAPIGKVEQRAAIASPWPDSASVKPAWGTGQLAADNGSDPVGAFRFICGIAGLNNDDMLVFPGQPGRSHLHQYYGQTSNAHSTYKTLREGTTSSCANGQYPGNLSSYWMPAMMDGQGNVVQPHLVSVYYKQLPKHSPGQGFPDDSGSGPGGVLVELPTRFKMIAGSDLKGGYTLNQRLDGGRPMSYRCITGQKRGNLRQALDECAVGETLIVDVNFPTCFDGRVDSPDHRSHVAYKKNHNTDGQFRCPKSHPYIMPELHVAPQYTVTAALKAHGHLSCNKDASIDCLHMDYVEAWSEGLRKAWQAATGCIDGHKNCSGGDLGDGRQLIGAAQPAYGWKHPSPVIPRPQSDIDWERLYGHVGH